MEKITIIICAYNEENTIAQIIGNVSDFIMIDEIIVVNDGSLDNTGEIIKKLKTEVDIIDIHLPVNKGKGYAMVKGIEYSNSEYLVFIDADLSNLKKEHIKQLVMPIINNEAEMVLGQATETLINHTVNPFTVFSGQRALKKKDILQILNKMKSSRFGVETILNLHYLSNNKTIKQIPLKKLLHPTKFKKTNFPIALKEFAVEGQEIFSTVFSNFDLVIKSIQNSISNNLKYSLK